MLRIGMLIRSFPSKQVPGMNAWLVPTLAVRIPEPSIACPRRFSKAKAGAGSIGRTSVTPTPACLHHLCCQQRHQSHVSHNTTLQSPLLISDAARYLAFLPLPSSFHLLHQEKISLQDETPLIGVSYHASHHFSSGPVSPTALPSHSTRLPDIARLISTGNHSTTPRHH
jgi:hypothetical protein